jgi:molybdopterin synthase sulfur carrier subunit
VPGKLSAATGSRERGSEEIGSVSAAIATVRYFGGAKIAAGMRSELVALRAGASVDGLVTALAESHGEALARVLAAASFLLDEVAVHDRSIAVPDGAVIDVLPPVAGG